MPWGWFALALGAAYLLQTAVLPHIAPAWIDAFLVMALTGALVLPMQEARIAGWMVGFAQDIPTTGPLGLHALALGLAALGVTHLRDLVNRELWWARWLIAMVSAIPGLLLVRLHERFYQAANLSAWQIVATTIVTAFIAGLIAALLPGVPGLFGRRRRHDFMTRW
jgi:rod shape-determining protein MreD